MSDRQVADKTIQIRPMMHRRCHPRSALAGSDWLHLRLRWDDEMDGILYCAEEGIIGIRFDL